MSGAGPASPLALLRMTDGLVLHHALCAAATLGVADQLVTGEQSAAALAAALGAHEDRLHRTLRFLAGHGVFRLTGPRHFANTPLSEYLRRDVPGSVRPILVFRGSPYFTAPFTAFLSCLQTGVPGRETVFGESTFGYLRARPGDEEVFDEAMTAISLLWAPAVAAAYDFGQWGSVTDVGGGNGALLSAVLRAHPAMNGVLVDAPSVLARARRRGLLAGDLAARTQFVPCDFFQAVPAGTRAYVLKNVVHDWNDADAETILRRCREAVPDDGVVLLVEYAVADDNEPSLGKTLDLAMMTITGGQERTAGEHAALLARAGFARVRAIPVSPEITIVEARP